MYVEQLKIRNFQSLHDVSIDLAPFTVIVGPSSSGKSALTRALKTLVQNRRGTDFITHGQKTCTIQAHLATGKVVTLSRSTTTAENFYLLQDSQNTAPIKFTKLGGEVPEEISQALQIAPKATLNFAGQFDKPYLLDESPSTAASELGSLTNVQVIFEAARESNRSKLQTSQTLKTRQQDLADAREALTAFENLAQREAAVGQIKNHLQNARDIQKRLDQAADTLDLLTHAARIIRSIQVDTTPLPDTTGPESTLERLRTALSLMSQFVATATTLKAAEKHLSAIPDATQATVHVEQLKVCLMVQDKVRAIAQTLRDSQAAITSADQDIEALNAAYSKALADSGTCPTCGQSVTASLTPA